MSDEDRINSYNLRRATKRLNRELTIIDKDPIPGIDLRANEDNILEWHFVMHGKEDTPYYGGMYHGKLIFPSNFPFSPPKILFLTPNGRFKTNERICFSLSDFHPEEWKPAFSVTTVLQGITDFMHENTETIGSIETSESVKRQLAESSSIVNAKDTIFCKLFPKLCGRKVTDSEDSSSESSPSKNTIFPVGEKTPSPDEITLPPRTQSPTSTEVTLPPTHLTPVLIETTPPSLPRETAMPEETLVSQDSTISPTDPTPKNIETNFQISPNIGSEEIPADNPDPPIKRSPDATDSQRKLPSLPKEKIHRQISSPQEKISPLRENTPSLDEVSLSPRTQSTIHVSTGITLPPTLPTPLPPPEETAKPEEILLMLKETVEPRVESSSPREIIKSSGEESRIPSETIQEQRPITPPTHTTPSVTKPKSYPVKYPGAQSSLRGVRPPLQNVSQDVYRDFIISPTDPTPKNIVTNFQISPNIGSEEIPADNPDPPIKRSPDATDSQRKLPSLPKEKIHRQIPSPEKEISPDVETFPVDNKNIQKRRNTAPPPHSTPLITKTIHDPVKDDIRPSKGKARTAQNESRRPFTISPIYSKQQNFKTNSQTRQCIELEERPAHYFDEYRKLPSPPIRPPGATDSQRNLPYLPKEIIPRQTPTPEREICPDIERGYPSIGVDGESLDRQEADVNSLRLHKFQRKTKRIHCTIGALVVFLGLILGILLIALLFSLTQIDYNQKQR